MVPKHIYEKLDAEEQKLWYITRAKNYLVFVCETLVFSFNTIIAWNSSSYSPILKPDAHLSNDYQKLTPRYPAQKTTHGPYSATTMDLPGTALSIAQPKARTRLNFTPKRTPASLQNSPSPVQKRWTGLDY